SAGTRGEGARSRNTPTRNDASRLETGRQADGCGRPRNGGLVRAIACRAGAREGGVMFARRALRRLTVGVVFVLLVLVLLLPGAASGYCLALDGCEPNPYPRTTLSVDVTAPKANATVSGVVTVTANPGGVKNQNVNRVEFYFDNILFYTDYTNPWKADWNTLDATYPAYDGQHALMAIA